jgi:hypothetical protein
MLVRHVQGVSGQVDLSEREICHALGVPYRNLIRWKGRIARGEQVVNRPGVQKEGTVDLEKLRKEIRGLRHGNKRTAGTGALVESHGNEVSRRELQAMVKLVRLELKREKRALMRRIEWNTARTVWSMDDTEYARSEKGQKLFLHQLQDLGSRHKFDPLVGPLAKGVEVAANLRELFSKYGPPLVLKRDNHRNLNNLLVDEVLAEFLVIPLNSPKSYPPYNGGIEQGNSEIKRCLKERHDCAGYCPQLVRSCAPLAVNDLNHRRRPCMNGRNSCEVFSLGLEAIKAYNRRKRKEIYQQIMQINARILAELDHRGPRAADAARRIAVETWLRRNGHISVSINGKVLPHF